MSPFLSGPLASYQPPSAPQSPNASQTPSLPLRTPPDHVWLCHTAFSNCHPPKIQSATGANFSSDFPSGLRMSGRAEFWGGAMLGDSLTWVGVGAG